MNEPDNRLSIDFSGLKIDGGDEDAETWLCDASDGPSLESTDCGTQSSNELLEWLEGSTLNIDYRTRSALSRRIRNHVNKKEKAKLKSPDAVKLFDVQEDDELNIDAAPVPNPHDQLVASEEEDEDEFFDAREDLSDCSFASPRALSHNNTLNTLDETTPTSTTPVPPDGATSFSTPRRSNGTLARTRTDSGSASNPGYGHATGLGRSLATPPSQQSTPKPNVNVKLRSNSRPPTAVVAPSQKAMPESRRPATSLSQRVAPAVMNTSFSQSNSRENSFQLGLLGDLYRSEFSKETKLEEIENIAKQQEEDLLKQLEKGVRERKSSFHYDSPSSRPGTAESHLATSRSVDFSSRLSPQPSFEPTHQSSKLPTPKARTGIPQPSTRLPMPASKIKTQIRAVPGGGYGSPFNAQNVAGTQVQAVRRKSAELVKPSKQPLSVYEEPAGLAQSRTPLGHRHNVIGNGGGINGSTNRTEANEWHDECF